MYYSDELYHHGIKGQRWGRRNGPPYPLSAQTHAAVVRSAGKRGKVGGLKEIGEYIRFGSVFDPSKEGHEVYLKGKKVNRKNALRTLGGGAAGAALGAGIGYAIKRDKNAALIGANYGGTAGSMAGSLSMYANKDYKDYMKSYRKGLQNLTAKQKARKSKVGGLSEEEARRAKRNKIIRNVAIGAGGAALAGAAAYGLVRRGGYGNYVKNFGRGGIKEMAQYAKVGARKIPKDIGGAVSSLRNRVGDSRAAQKVGRSLGNIKTNMTTGYYKARGKAFNSKAYGNIERNGVKVEGRLVRNANKVRNSINTGRYAVNRGTKYLKSLAADNYGYQAVNTITRGTKLAAKGAALGAAGTYIYKKRKKRRR